MIAICEHARPLPCRFYTRHVVSSFVHWFAMTYRIPLSKPSLAPGSEYYLQQVMRDGFATGGPFGHACEAWLDTHAGRSVLLTSSCTGALEMAACLAGIRRGDEIIMPSFTFPSTANAFVRLGARPVFVDIRLDTFNIDEALVAAAITPRTRAIVPVHYAGVACAMERLVALCRTHDLWLIEDAAQGVMASYCDQPLGTFGDFAAISFHSTKNIGCGEGGALLLQDGTRLEEALCLRDKGTNRQAFLRGEVTAYQWVACGSSYGLSDLHAALLLSQLEEAKVSTQQRLMRWQYYDDALQEAEVNGLLRRPKIPPGCCHNAHVYAVLLPTRACRDRVQRRLNRVGIGACPHYSPLHVAPAGRNYGSSPLPVTEAVASTMLRLPLWNDISRSEQREVIERLLACLDSGQC